MRNRHEERAPRRDGVRAVAGIAATAALAIGLGVAVTANGSSAAQSSGVGQQGGPGGFGGPGTRRPLVVSASKAVLVESVRPAASTARAPGRPWWPRRLRRPGRPAGDGFGGRRVTDVHQPQDCGRHNDVHHRCDHSGHRQRDLRHAVLGRPRDRRPGAGADHRLDHDRDPHHRRRLRSARRVVLCPARVRQESRSIRPRARPRLRPCSRQGAGATSTKGRHDGNQGPPPRPAASAPQSAPL